MQTLVASTKSADFLNNTIFKGGGSREFAYTFHHPNGRELRRKAERKAKRDAKKGIPTPPYGFIETLELL
tara:strand:+ start:43 stop:252 length:210 start_codon:yes stop_codon:yes gene_type:complete